MADAATVLPKQSFHFFRQMLFMSNLQGKLDGRARKRESERELIKPNNEWTDARRLLGTSKYLFDFHTKMVDRF